MFSRNFIATFAFPAVLLLHLTAEQVLASSNFIPLSLGPDFQIPFSENDILRGFKLNIADGESPLKSPVFQGEVRPIPFSTSYTISRVVKSTQEIKDMMEIDGSLSVSYGPMISGSGKGSYLDHKVSTKHQVSVLYRTRRVAFARSIDIGTLTPADAGLYTLDSDEIADLYGTKFIDQMIYGAQLDVIFTVTSSKDVDITEIEAELKGKIGVGVFSAEFKGKFEKQEGEEKSRYQMSIVAQASGIDFATPSNPTLENINDLIDDFNDKYDGLLDAAGSLDDLDDEENVLNQLSPVGFTLASIADHTKLDRYESSALDSKMDDLRDVFYNALFWKSQLRAFRSTQELMYASDPRERVEIYEPYSDEMDDVIFRLDEKIKHCLLYRQSPLANIIGKDGAEIAAVPEEYPKGDDLYIAQGLIGEAYIPSPVTVETTKFPGIHYVGFALPSLSGTSLEPWMGGKLRLDDDDNTIIAAADTPQELERLGYVTINQIEAQGFDFVKYGDVLQLQVNNVDSRWLSGNRRGNGDVITRNKREANAFQPTYEWVARSTIIDAEEPKLDECVRYGDIIYLRNEYLHDSSSNSTQHQYLGDINTKLKTEDPSNDALGSPLSSFEWIISSEYENPVDPAHGECVQTLSVVYIRLNHNYRKWLSGGHGASNEKTETLDILSDIPIYFNERVTDGSASSSCPLGTEIKSVEECKEAGLSLGGKLRNQEVVYGNWPWIPCGCSVVVGEDDAIHFDYSIDDCDRDELISGWFQPVCRHNQTVVEASQWIIRKTTGNGKRTDGLWCSATSAKGAWIPLEYTPDRKDVGYTVGITERLNDDHPYWTRSDSWERSVVASVAGGFTYGPSELEVDWLEGSHLADSVQGAVQDIGNANHTEMFGPGQIWQFVYEMDDLCDPLWRLKSNDLVITADDDQEPCCLPGFEANPDQPHGPCKLLSPCQCAEEICNPPKPTTEPTTEPTLAPTDKPSEDSSAGTSLLVSRAVVLSITLPILIVSSVVL